MITSQAAERRDRFRDRAITRLDDAKRALERDDFDEAAEHAVAASEFFRYAAHWALLASGDF